MLNKKMVAMANDCAISNGDNITTASAEKEQQVKIEAYSPQKKAIEYLKGTCYGIWIEGRPFRLAIYFYNRNISSFIC